MSTNVVIIIYLIFQNKEIVLSMKPFGMEMMTARSNSCYIVGSLDRPEAASFMTDLEYTHYPPDTDLNELYNVFPALYGGTRYFIIEIPMKDMKFINNEFITSYDLILQNGLPFGNHGKFPLICNDAQAWTLETKIHKGENKTPEQIHQLLIDEHQIIKDKTPMSTKQVCRYDH